MQVNLSAAARRDISGIWTYSAERWGKARADLYVRALAKSFDELARETIAGRSCDGIRPGYYKLAVGAHLIFYRKPSPDQIAVVRILHRRMDVDQHL